MTGWQGYNLWENQERSEEYYESVNSTHLYTRKAIEHAQKFSNQKWFLYLSYQAVHDPVVVGDERYVTETSCKNASASSS